MGIEHVDNGRLQYNITIHYKILNILAEQFVKALPHAPYSSEMFKLCVTKITHVLHNIYFFDNANKQTICNSNTATKENLQAWYKKGILHTALR